MKIAVGLSGGVDSAVTAALLKEQGHEVVGVFMKNWSDDFGIKGDCPWERDLADAKAVAEHLGIEFLSYNFERQYRERVIEYFFAEYKAGRTPNPDVLCNSEIKFNLFLKKCLLELGADKIATGHYARIEMREAGSRKQSYGIALPASLNQTYSLLKGVDTNKDQSYFLCQLTQDELSKALFPIGELTKPQVREIAKKLNLPVAEKKDSQGICFVGKIDVHEFIYSELGAKRGDIIDKDTSKNLGRHKGLWFYTIGQREGLGLGGGPWFVVEKELSTNTLFVVKGSNNPELFKQEVLLKEMNFINDERIKKTFEAEVSLRYRQKPQPAVLTRDGEAFKVLFSTPQRAVAPGQFGCVYIGDELVSSGVIQ
jgi:tRNA-uridine 2-sulfurtransferase